MTDLYVELKKDREKIVRTLNKLEHTSVGVPEAREELLAKLSTMIARRVRAEEDQLHPELLQDEAGRRVVADARARNRETERLLEQLGGTPPTERTFGLRTALLSGHLRLHFAHEDADLLPAAHARIPREMAETLGLAIVRARKAA